MRELLVTARPELVPWLAIAGFAGLRSAELQRPDWSEVNLAERHIEITAKKAKTAARRLTPITDNLAAWLVPYPHHASKQTQIAVTAGDEALRELGIQKLDGIVLDVEGWECHALAGLRQTILSSVPRWAIIENANWALEGAGKTSRDLHELIESFGWCITNPGEDDLLCFRNSR